MTVVDRWRRASGQEEARLVERLNIRQVEAFEAVMLLGNMTKAAELMQISQPAVSRLIADLQKAVGFKLFHRTRHGTVPTTDAERLSADVKSLFSGLDELSRRVHAIRNLELGELRIGTISLYGNGLLPRMIADFLDRHPRLEVGLEVDAHDRIVDRVAARRCDLGLVSLPAFSGDLAVQRVASRPALCVMPAGHPLAARDVVRAADLDGAAFVGFPRDTSTRVQIDAIFERHGIVPDLRVTAGTHEAVCSLVAAGVGLSIVSPFSPHVDGDPALVFRPFEPALTREVGLICDEDHLSVTARAFRDFAIAHFARHYPDPPPPKRARKPAG